MLGFIACFHSTIFCAFESHSEAILQTMTVKLTGRKEFTKDDR